jgi:hypothetical protein
LGCKTANSVPTAATKEQVQVAINLDAITNDQVMVTVNAPSIKTDEITYHIPKQFQEPIQKTTTVDTSKI